MKPIHIIIVMLVVIILGAGAYFSFSGKNPLPTQEQGVTKDAVRESEKPNKNQAVEESDELSINGNILDIFKTNKNLKCTYSSSEDDVNVSGTVYISGKRVRSDYEMVLEGQKTEGHMVMDDDWVYTWTSAAPQGIKMKFTEADFESTSDDIRTDEGTAAYVENYDYRCSGWVVDSSKFVLPTDVTFTDFTETVKDVQTGQTDLCAACDFAADETQKAQCKANLGCE